MYTHYEYYTQVFLLKPRVQFGMLRRNKNKNSRVSTLPEESPPYQFMNLEFLYPYIQDFKKHRIMYLICCVIKQINVVRPIKH